MAWPWKKTCIGVHAGPAIVGNFGGSRFFEYTAYGDTINVAARLEVGKQGARHDDMRQRRCCVTRCGLCLLARRKISY